MNISSQQLLTVAEECKRAVVCMLLNHALDTPNVSKCTYERIYQVVQL